MSTNPANHQILVFVGRFGCFGMDYIHATDLEDLREKAKKLVEVSLYEWDKLDRSGWPAGSFKVPSELDESDWQWLITQPPYSRHMLTSRYVDP